MRRLRGGNGFHSDGVSEVTANLPAVSGFTLAGHEQGPSGGRGEGKKPEPGSAGIARGPLNLGPQCLPLGRGPQKGPRIWKRAPSLTSVPPGVRNLTQFKGPDHRVGTLLSGLLRDRRKTKITHQKA